jgi:hypothetical protein
VESLEGVSAKRRVLVDALTMCLSRSKVCETISPDTIRSVIDSASTELWREGEFRLEYVWKILCQQPGLTAKEVAPPLLVFKAYESELGVAVRVPQALSALPRGEQVRLREELGITRDDFSKVLAELQAITQAEAQRQEEAQVAAQAAQEAEAVEAAKAEAPKSRRPLAIALSAVAALALAGSLFQLDDLAGILKLQAGKRQEHSLTARIVDPKWEGETQTQKRETLGHLLDGLSPMGIKVLNLTDDTGRIRALASDAGDKRLLMIYP